MAGFVQGKAFNSGASQVNVNSFGGAFASNNTALNCILVFATCNTITGNMAATPTCADTNNNTYVLVASNGGAGTSAFNGCFATTGITGGANTVVVSAPGTGYWETVFGEWNGYYVAINGTPAIASGSSTTLASGNTTTTLANCLLVLWGVSGSNSTLTPGGGFTTRVQDVSVWDGTIADLLEASAGTYSGTLTTGTSGAWNCILVGLAPGAGSPTAVSPNCSPLGGHYDYPVVVRMTTPSAGASIYYTLDGSTPTTASTLYTGPIALNPNPLNMIASGGGFSTSPVVTCYFYIQVGGLWATVDDQFDLTNPTTALNRRVHQFEGMIMYNPPDGYWYKYGQDYDVNPVGNLYIYRSPDLLNWFAMVQGTYGYVGVRPWCIYNPSNGTYVLWGNYELPSGVAKASWVSLSPIGPFTQVNNYDTYQGISIDTGDHSLYYDPNTGNAYLLTVCNGNSSFYVIQLSKDFLSLTSNSVYTASGLGGEAPTMWSNGPGSYFLMQSGQTNYAPNLNQYEVASTPLHTWTYAGANPFQAATISQTPGEVAAGITATNLNAYDTQTCQVLVIPGRYGFLYYGDRYDGGGNPLPNYRRIVLPVVHPTSITATITWAATWNLNTTFPTISGWPQAATNLVVKNGIATWQNNEVKACAIYLDNSTVSTFASNVVSEVLQPGANTFTIAAAAMPGAFFRVRTVNANGSSVSGGPGVVGAGPIPTPVSWGTMQTQSSFSNTAGFFPTPPATSSTDEGSAFNVPDFQMVAGGASYVPAPGRGIVTCSGAGVVQYNINPGPTWTTVVSNLPCRIVADGVNVRFTSPAGPTLTFTFYRETGISPFSMVP
jgi:hypothetical protein